MSGRRRSSTTWAARREALLRAAAAEVSANGFDALTLDAVARRAGVSKGAVQYAFGTKGELLAALARWALASFARAVVAAPDDAGDGDLMAIVDRFTEGLAGNEDILRTIISLVATNGREAWATAPLTEYHSVARTRIVPVIGSALRRSAGRLEHVTDEEIELLARGVRALILGLYAHWTVAPAGRSREDVAREVRAILALMLELPRRELDRPLWSRHEGEEARPAAAGTPSPGAGGQAPVAITRLP